jgi:hypothetical protein
MPLRHIFLRILIHLYIEKVLSPQRGAGSFHGKEKPHFHLDAV